MTKPASQNERGVSPRGRRDALLFLVVAVGLSCAVGLTRWFETRRVHQASFDEEENLYITAGAAKRLSMSFAGLAADWYWMRSLQYVGRKVIGHQAQFQFDDLSELDLRLLPQLLDVTVTLDPHFIAAYEYGAMVLPAVDADAALGLLRKGIEANPQEWRLYHFLGYIHWQRGQFNEASEAYAAGAALPGAPPWMRAMSAQMQVGGGSRAVARDIYRRMHSEADDEQVKTMALKRLLQVDSLDERDAIRRVLGDHRARGGSCARQWREVSPLLGAARLRVDASGSPLDPTGVPYALDAAACEVELGEQSEIPRR